MKKPLLKSDKYYTLVPKVPIEVTGFVWSSHVSTVDGKQTVIYDMYIHGNEYDHEDMTEEELLKLYDIKGINI